MPTFFSRKVNFTSGVTPSGVAPKSINIVTPGIGAHSRNIRRVLNRQVIKKKCDCNRRWY